MYCRLGGCLGDTTKLGPLASTYLWAWVEGLLDKLITHFRMGSSDELPLREPWRLLTLAACLIAWGTWGRAALSLWELVLTAWGEALTAWELWLFACIGTVLSPWEGVTAWGNALTAWESALSTWGLPFWTVLSPSGVNAGCLRRGADCLGVSVLCLGTTCLCGDSAISLGVSAGWLGTTCLWGDSAISLGDSIDCLGRDAGYMGISTLCLGTTCLRGNSASTACLVLALLVNQVIFPSLIEIF